MCGIAAIFGNHLEQEIYQAILPMTTLIRHRGPDDEGFVFFDAFQQHILGGVETPANAYESAWDWAPKRQELPSKPMLAALGHRRLAIIDLSPAGHQPLCSSDQRYWITYNGEIYNYLELREELSSLGHTFITETDTEVILKAYQEWGKECFDFFNGMFAFVIYDKVRQKAIAVRDRFGVKPLYMWQSPLGFVAFASEIKQFTVLPGWRAKLQGQRVYDFLNWGVLDHSSETLFEGVTQVRGGEYALVSANEPHKLQIRSWYTLKATPFKGTFEDASKHFTELLQDAIRLRLRADVPVGSCLSGGMDSSSIVCLMNRLLQNSGKQMTFSACSHNKRFCEKEFIDLVVSQTGVKAHFTYPTLEELKSLSRKIVWHQDEPFGSTSILAQWMVFKLAKEHVTVMLDGQGADEQLAGYLGFFGNSFYDHFTALKWNKLLNEMRQAELQHPLVQPWGLLLNKLVPEMIRQPIRKFLGKSAKYPGWLNTAKLNATLRDPFANAQNKSLLDQSILQLQHSNLPMLLHWEDRNSMAHAVESRTPFLDYRLVEFNLGLPTEYKIGQGWTKKVLREGLKGILPERIRTRVDKMAFVTAEEEWVRKEAPDHFRKGVAETLERANGILHPSVRTHAEDIISGRRPYNYSLWRLVSFGEWLERFAIK